MTLKRYRELAIVTTVGICVLVVAGGAVRLTGSGLGCDDWPNCNDQRFIDVTSGHTAIEQLNRLLSGLIGLPTLLLAIVSFRAAKRGSGLRWPALGVLVSVVANAVVGGSAVIVDLHPAMIMSHFLLAMVSIAFGLIAIRAGSGVPISWRLLDGQNRLHQLVGALMILMIAALVTGTVVTGAGPHAGDEEARRFGFDIGSVARFHSVTVIASIATAILIALIIRRGTEFAPLQSALSSWFFVGLVQGGIGYTQYFNGVPELLVGVHIAGATLLWFLTLRLGIAMLDLAGSGGTSSRNAIDAESFAT
jgi:cytochrome c oxidase assembly protein subunit 15